MIRESLEEKDDVGEEGNLNETAIRFKMVIDEMGDDSSIRLLSYLNIIDASKSKFFKAGDFPYDKLSELINIVSGVKYSASKGHTVSFQD